MNAPFSIQLSGLTKVYQDRTVLSVDSMVFESGHSYALIGPNGSGKSTLLRILSGIIEATDGTIDTPGIDASALRVCYMPQKSYVFGFSVFRNVALALEKSGLSKSEVEKRVHEALAAVGMDELTGASGSGLSGGEAQRVAFARLLVQNPDVMLLDEPTASMDIEGTACVEEALARYRQNPNSILICATHAPAQASRIADFAYMLSGGKLVESGPVNDVFANPQSAAGKEFLSYWSLSRQQK